MDINRNLQEVSRRGSQTQLPLAPGKGETPPFLPAKITGPLSHPKVVDTEIYFFLGKSHSSSPDTMTRTDNRESTVHSPKAGAFCLK